jgi:acyl-CoA thioesterase-1
VSCSATTGDAAAAGLSRVVSIAARLCLAALVLLSGCADESRYSALGPGAVVLAFGDSVTHGTGAGRGEDYPSRLALATGWRVINAGIPGDTAGQARERIEPLLAEHSPSLVIVALGGNDFLRQRSPAAVKEDLRAIVQSVRGAGALPVLVAVPRLSLLRATVGALDDSPIYAELADEEGVLLVEGLFSEVLSDEALRADPIHPNAAGYQVFAAGLDGAFREAGLAGD